MEGGMMNSGTVLQQILEWSSSQPLWFRDGLRRVVLNNGISTSDIEELTIQCKEKSLNIQNKTKISIPLEKSHLPAVSSQNLPVRLVSIGNLTGVNRLLSNQTIKFGGSPGLTVIYGENGSGKTGYARVIKKACRTRGADPVIKPDVFEPQPSIPPKADIEFQKETSSPFLFQWETDKESHPELSNVFVFDANTAHHYLNQDDSTCFTPFGLDILPSMIKVYDAVGKKINDEVTTIETEIASVKKNWKYEPKTKVAHFLDSLNHESNIKLLQELSTVSDEDHKRLGTLQNALNSDPLKKSQETNASLKRIQTFSSKLNQLENALQEDKLSELKVQIEKHEEAAKRAKAFSENQFSGLLTGTGGKEWKTLWEAAKKFSMASAYAEKDFPVTDMAKCVLCQQDLLGNDVRERLKAFDTFVKDQSQKEAEKEKLALDTLTGQFNQLEKLESQLETIDADLQEISQEQKDEIKTYIVSSSQRLNAIQEICNTSKWKKDIPRLESTPKNFFVSFIQTLDDRAKTEASADNPEIREALIREKKEIEAKVWLDQVKTDVESQIKRLIKLALLNICKPKNSKFISDKNKALTQVLVTEVYCSRFQIELTRLGLTTLSVCLEEAKSPKGITRFGCRLKSAKQANVYEVASEGEQRSIALAAFLAELTQATHKSALVFDDPVSSLDHWRREKIAKRLIDESTVRQVIVFTHDSVFLNDLETYSEQSPDHTAFRFLEWNSGKPGYVQDGLPWDCKSPEDRIDRLEKLQKKIQKAWNPNPSEHNVTETAKAYSWLRATIERIVEKVVFNGVVTRFRTYIELKNLDKVIGFKKDECDELKRIYKKCCNVTDAHDKAQAKQSPGPAPEELLKDINDTKVLLESIRSRKNAG